MRAPISSTRLASDSCSSMRLPKGNSHRATSFRAQSKRRSTKDEASTAACSWTYGILENKRSWSVCRRSENSRARRDRHRRHRRTGADHTRHALLDGRRPDRQTWRNTGPGGLRRRRMCLQVSVHGANRLGGNSLLETIVFGKRFSARAHAADYVKKVGAVDFPTKLRDDEDARLQAMLANKGGERVNVIRDAMGKAMMEGAGIYRRPESISVGIERIRELKKRYKNISLDDKGHVFNTDLTGALELGFLLDVAETTLAGALQREESRGAHTRVDFPERDDEHWMKHTQAHFRPDADPELSYKSVTMTKWQPQARVY